MLLFRVSRKKHARDLSGTGARLNGGRWNSPGIAALYTSGTQSLALLETLAHTSMSLLEDDFVMLTLELNGKIGMDEWLPAILPPGWQDYPAPLSVMKMGDAWLTDNKHLLLKVPSVVVPTEFNYIINPLHKDMTKVVIQSVNALQIDKRVLKSVE
jgi:RES domain-containing protein